MSRRDFEVSPWVTVVLKVSNEKDNHLLDNLQDVIKDADEVRRVSRSTITGREFEPATVLEIVRDPGNLKVLTVLLGDEEEFETWSAAIDPGWRAGSLFSALVGVGFATLGIAGYIRQGSQAALSSGMVIGTLMIVSSWLIRSGKAPRVGHALCTTIAFAVVRRMGPKALRLMTFYPVGGIVIASILSCAYNTVAFVSSYVT
ncbi:hypothetical protein NDN08_005549 [Rhodosorus marinus]|uniref:Uncharacterized protein n=1 Tax=Rhodosorus marinus TaxID=101924 RepID=A0AAV8V2R7_9RHOD|nr:hypothetical protein NDN08_005549 [Rhodosorus marinus]